MNASISEVVKLIKAYGSNAEKFKKLITYLEGKQDKDITTTPGNPNLASIKSVTETAFQRAIFNGNPSKLTFQDGSTREVRWVDLELPVTFERKPRRKCVDLVGMTNNKKACLCELKFMSKHGVGGDMPEYGLFELLAYYSLILANASALNERKVFHTHEKCKKFSWETFNTEPLLILAANSKYWEHWFNKSKNNRRHTIMQLLNDIKEKLSLDIHLFRTDDIDFEKQKGHAIMYEPAVESDEWMEIF